MDIKSIRNFCIIAHIDHGKSTLADRFLEITGTVEKRRMKEQYLDQLELERERGITIKMAPVRMKYAPQKNADNTRNDAENELLYEDITFKIRGAAFEVRKRLGLGHKESVYRNALAQEFSKKDLRFEAEKSIGIFYDGKKVGSYQPDFVIENKIIIELKALPELGRPQTEQLWSYLKGSDYKLALLINFGNKNLDIKRVVYDSARFPRISASVQQDSAQVEYTLNLIDTPGHSDFSYEVSRALAAVEGAILLVDATQGIQAQTLANFYSAKKAGLKIIGAVNKIDLNPPTLNDVLKNTAELIGVPEDEIFKISGKTGEGVKELLEAVIQFVPSPENSRKKLAGNNTDIDNKIFRALIFDSFYHEHKGVVAGVRVFDGEISEESDAYLIATDTHFKIKELGYFVPELKKTEKLENGQIGYIATGLKTPELLRIGDTVSNQKSVSLALLGYQEPQPVVFVSFYPENSDEYEELKNALAKLRLNDSSLKFESDFNEFLGRGFKAGFLGRLHFEITSERLEREFNVHTVHSFPSVSYKVLFRGKPLGKSSDPQKPEYIIMTNPEDFPLDYLETLEPIAKIKILTPITYLGQILKLQEIFHLSNINTETLGHNTSFITAHLPLADLIRDFDDRLKSVSAGYASFSYEISGYEKTEIVKLGILVAGQSVSGLTRIVHKEEMEREARRTVEKLKDLLPHQQFSQSIQAVVGGKVVAREDIPAMKKDVTGYLYGGDRTRKMKLWKKQQRGKLKLKKLASTKKISVPAKVFKELLQR